ncbi:MAG: sugar transporter family protein [Gammaproteobacteria bacterium]|nr:sugar transporter family protein [Gammaproteobacteria bacterium]
MNMRAAKGLNWQNGLLVLLSVVFVLYVDFLQTLPLSFSQEIGARLGLTLNQFGELINAFDTPLVFLFLFFGFIVDLLGAKKALLLSVALLVLGNYAFTEMSMPNALLNARYIMGIGALFVSVSILVLMAQRLPKNLFCVFAGLFLALSTLSKFLSVNLQRSLFGGNWDHASLFLNIAGVSLFVLFCFVPGSVDNPDIAPRKRLNIDELVATLKNRNLWFAGIIAVCGYLFVYLFLSSIGPAFLTDIGGFSETELMYVFNSGIVSLVAGLFLIGVLGYFLHQHGRVIQFFYSVAALSFILVCLFSTHRGFDMMLLCLSAFGSAAYVLTYAIVYENAPKACLGTAFSLIFIAIYLGSLLGDILVQASLLNVNHAALNNTVPLWHDLGWVVGILIPAFFIIGIVFAQFLREPQTLRLTNSTFFEQFKGFWKGASLGRTFWLGVVLGGLFVGNVVLSIAILFNATLIDMGGWSVLAISQLSRFVYLLFAFVCLLRSHASIKRSPIWKVFNAGIVDFKAFLPRFLQT